jgi:hypothetical protein
MAIKQRLQVSFTIANNLLAPNTKATNLGISLWVTTTIAWNNSKNLEDGTLCMKHPKKCSQTILNRPPKNKWKVVVKACETKSYLRQKCA